MTKEQEESLEKLKRQMLIGECEKNIGIPVFISDLKNVLSMLEEKNKEIQFQKDINKTELDRHKNTEKSQKGIINKQNKIIDLMAERITLTEEEWKEIQEKNVYNAIEKDIRKQIKQYFANKAKELLNK